MNIMPGFGIAMGAISGRDADLAAWIAAVEGDGGTVSDDRATIVEELITSLKADGVWAKLDRLWLFAAENSQSALRDIVAADQATAVNSPTFTADVGINADASTSYVDTNYNPTADGTNYVLNSAHMAIWDSTDAAGSTVQISVVSGSFSELAIRYGPLSGKTGCAINNGGPTYTVTTSAVSTTLGFWHGNRSGSSATEIYHNGAAAGSDTVASNFLPNDVFFIGARNNGGPSVPRGSDIISAVSLGGSLNSTEAADLYTHLQTYMTAVMSEAATAAWVAEVSSNGGTVSAGREILVKELIAGLLDDGIWHKLDRLWLFAAEDDESALTDLKGLTLATNNNSTTFTADEGFTGNGSNMFIDTNFDPSGGGFNFTQNACSWMAWNNTGGTDGGAIFSSETTDLSRLFPAFGDGQCYWDVNNNSIDTTNDFANASPIGCYIGVRTGSAAATIDKNGVQQASSTNTSATLTAQSFNALRAAAGANFSSRQISALGFGGSLSSGERADFYTRLQTYMTAVGL